MGVTGKHERHVQLRGMLQAPWIVREKDGVGARSLEDRRQVFGAAGPEANAHEVDRFVANRDSRPLILQHGEPTLLQRCGHVAVIVMVAKNREGAQRRVGQW